MRTGRRSAAGAAGSILLTLAAAGGVVCIALVVLAFAFDVTLIMFRTGSMGPTIPAGSLAIVREIPAGEVTVGDIVTVDRPGQLPVTHRVTSVSDGADAATRVLTLKGDANTFEDPAPYEVASVRVVLASAPGLARVVVWFGNPVVLGGITIAASVLVTWAFWPRRRDEGAAAPEAKAPMGALTVVAIATALGVTAGTAPQAAHAAPVKHTVTGTHLSVTTIGDETAMQNLAPDIPVDWIVGVSAREDAPGTVSLAFDGSGDAAPGIMLEVTSCTERWTTSCGGLEQVEFAAATAPTDAAEHPLPSMTTAEERWFRFRVWLPAGASAGSEPLTLTLHARGQGDDIGVSTGPLPQTGRDLWPALAGAGAAVAGGLAIVGVGALRRRRTRGSAA